MAVGRRARSLAVAAVLLLARAACHACAGSRTHLIRRSLVGPRSCDMSSITRSRVCLLIAALALTAAERSGSAAAAPERPTPAATAGLVNLPLSFVENAGGADARVRFFARGPRYGFYFTQREIVLAFLNEAATDEHALAMRFVGANANAAISGAGERGTFNDFHGSDPSRWRTRVPAYSAIVYRNLWPHVDLHVRGAGGTLKYEFHVAPGAAPDAIRLAYDGASSLAVDAAGALIVGTGIGALRDAPPISYQEIDGVRVPVESRYLLDARDRRFGFAFGAYRSDRELVVDPGIEFTTFLGGSSHEMPGGTAVDASGNVYVAGFTQSPDFPTTVGALKRTGAAQNSVEAFVTKMNPAGTALVYSTFIGGSDFDWARRIAIDASGNAYIAGQTKSADFPTTAGAFSRTLAVPPNCPRCFADNYDAFVLKLNATGSA